MLNIKKDSNKLAMKKQVIAADSTSAKMVYTLTNDIEYTMPLARPLSFDASANINGVLIMYAEAQDKGIDIMPIISFFSSLKGINDAMYRHDEYKALVNEYVEIFKGFESLPLRNTPLNNGIQFIDALHYLGDMKRAEIYFTGMMYGYHAPKTPDMIKALEQKQKSFARYDAMMKTEVKEKVSPVTVKSKKEKAVTKLAAMAVSV